MDDLRTLEEKLLQPEFRRNRNAVAALLADEFREFGSSGRVWTKQQILDRLESEPSFKAKMSDFRAAELASGVALITYRVTVEKRASLRSSIWIKRDGRWQMIFHQGTPTSHSWSEYPKSGSVASPEFMDEVENLPVQERDL